MAIEMGLVECTPFKTSRLTFNHKIIQFVLGIKHFKLQYREGHHVQQIKIRLDAQASGNRLSITPTLILRDGSGNEIDPKSFVHVSIAAITDSDSNNVVLAHRDKIIGRSTTINIPPEPKFCLGFPNGFNLEYSSAHDNEVQDIRFTASASRRGAMKAQLEGEAIMHDQADNSAIRPQVDGGIVAASENADNIVAINTRFFVGQHRSQKEKIEFGNLVPPGKKIAEAMAVLQNYKVSYGNHVDHYVTVVAGGCIEGVKPTDRTSVTLGGIVTLMHDDSGNNQNDNESGSAFVVIARLAPDK